MTNTKIIVAKIISGLIVGGSIILGILLLTGVVKNKHKNNNTKPKETKQLSRPPFKPQDTFIRPKEYEIGPIPDHSCKTANLCNDKVLYPIQGLKPYYGYEISDECPCTQFIHSP